MARTSYYKDLAADYSRAVPVATDVAKEMIALAEKICIIKNIFSELISVKKYMKGME